MNAGSPERTSPAEGLRTLTQVHHAVAECRPRQDASLLDWLAYHERAAAWFAEVAEIDRGHHHEALATDGEHRQLAKELKTQLLAPRPVGKDGG